MLAFADYVHRIARTWVFTREKRFMEIPIPSVLAAPDSEDRTASQKLTTNLIVYASGPQARVGNKQPGPAQVGLSSCLMMSSAPCASRSAATASAHFWPSLAAPSWLARTIRLPSGEPTRPAMRTWLPETAA